MYNNFPQAFKHGGYVLDILSLLGSYMLNILAFYLKLIKYNPMLDIREESSHFKVYTFVSGNRQNSVKHYSSEWNFFFKKSKNRIKGEETLLKFVYSSVFTSIEGLLSSMHHISINLINIYTSLPKFNYRMMYLNQYIIVFFEFIKIL